MGKANNRGGNNICRAYLRFYTYNVFTYCTVQGEFSIAIIVLYYLHCICS